MKLYRNVMEDVVEDVLDDVLETTDCCKCEHCHADMMAFALNLLPSKYVVTSVGASYAKISQLRQQQHADVLAAVTRAIDMVKDEPHHDTFSGRDEGEKKN